MRREQRDIDADILRLAGGGAIKTQIIYGANLNFKVAKKYMSRLMTSGLLVHDGGGTGSLYHTTERGHEFLRIYGALKDISQPHPILAV